ncbi:hypothetical protein R1sor_022768 [Riccia sorocarpa]|uniref:Uncharacterized protein n=1 Tax=Riccia sorocarpa TaxID=122646 RepID=A0ABD3GMW0_9MARC
MATTNVVRTVVGNSPAAADSGKGAGAGAEAAIVTPMLETAAATTKALVQADLMVEAISESEVVDLEDLVRSNQIWFWGSENNSDSKPVARSEDDEGNDGFFSSPEHYLYGSGCPGLSNVVRSFHLIDRSQCWLQL